MVWDEHLSPVAAAGSNGVPAGASLGRSQRGMCCLLDLSTGEQAPKEALSRWDGKAIPSRSQPRAWAGTHGTAQLCFPSSAFLLSLARLCTQQDSVSLNKS